jgi:hypothetical protein
LALNHLVIVSGIVQILIAQALFLMVLLNLIMSVLSLSLVPLLPLAIFLALAPSLLKVLMAVGVMVAKSTICSG